MSDALTELVYIAERIGATNRPTTENLGNMHALRDAHEARVRAVVDAARALVSQPYPAHQIAVYCALLNASLIAFDGSEVLGIPIIADPTMPPGTFKIVPQPTTRPRDE